ncbi:hypothetical protein Leryth_012671 [Lithospermum erythrorhizon]|nr:hypothetical protein Leryth_012671 [Lithospermum erythrorhizon]
MKTKINMSSNLLQILTHFIYHKYLSLPHFNYLNLGGVLFIQENSKTYHSCYYKAYISPYHIYFFSLIKIMKKRGGDKHIQEPILDEAAKAKIKYQTLLIEFFQLQKENVKKKRKLRTAKQKRGILLFEVGFLKRRLRHLKRNHPCTIEQPKHIVHDQSVDMETRTGETKSSYLIPNTSMNSNLMDEREQRKEEDQTIKQEQTQVKIPKNYFLDAAILGNNKDESLHDQVLVEINTVKS